MISNLHCRSQTCFDTCLYRSCEQIERCCYSETTTSFQHDRIELCKHIEKREKQNKKREREAKQEKKSAHIYLTYN